MKKLHQSMKKDKEASEYFVDKKREHINYVVTEDGRLMKVKGNTEKLVGYKEKFKR